MKRRTREHIIADLSANHVERQALLCGYAVERVRHDYGVDLLLFTFDSQGQPEPSLVFLQLKATDRLRRMAKRRAVAQRVERRDLIAWARQMEPVILIVYDTRSEVAYWLHVQQHLRDRPRLALTRTRGTVTLRIPIENVLTPDTMRVFARLKERIGLRLYEEDEHGPE